MAACQSLPPKTVIPGDNSPNKLQKENVVPPPFFFSFNFHIVPH